MKEFQISCIELRNNRLKINVTITFDDKIMKIDYKEENLEKILIYNEILDFEELNSKTISFYTAEEKYVFRKEYFRTDKEYEEFSNEIKELVIVNKINERNKGINYEFNIPFYIFEEIVEYIEQVALGKNKTSKWKNIKALLRLAFVNGRLTKQQVEQLELKYNREK